MSISMRQIASTLDPLEPPTSLRDLNRRHRWLNGNQALRQVANRHNHPQTKHIRFLSYNTFLMNVKEVAWLNHGAKKPAVDARAGELGPRLVREGYDLMALCEVWGNDYKRQVLSAWGWPRNNADWPTDNGRWAIGQTSGPGDPKIDSGLLQICANQEYRIRYREVKEFEDLSGEEWWSHKGMLLTRVFVGVGVLEIYSTHLSSQGCDLLSNVQDLQRFYTATHVPQNVAVITGDFNINARDSNNLLFDFIVNNDLQDIWYEQWGDRYSGGYSHWRNPGGYTQTKPAQDDNARQISERISSWVGVDDPDHPGYCHEPALDGQPEGRIDLILVESPTVNHTFNLDVTRIRRRSFKRDVSTESMDYLSDHIGLDVTFIVNPR